jgi:hypothetical protein
MLSWCNNLGLVVCSGDLYWHVDDEFVFSHLWFPKWWQHIGYGHKFLVDKIFVWTHTTSPSTYLVWVGN